MSTTTTTIMNPTQFSSPSTTANLYSLTPLEISIIQALRQTQFHQRLKVNDANANHVASSSITTRMAAITQNHSHGSRTNSPITATTTTTTSTETNTPPPKVPTSSLARYTQSRPYNAPLSPEEMEVLNRPLLPVVAYCSQQEGPTEKDVLLGRGGKTNIHLGNRTFRQVVQDRQELYRNVPKYDKIWIAQNVVSKIHETGGRFLRLSAGEWVEVPLKKAIEKASQALRERERSSLNNPLKKKFRIH